MRWLMILWLSLGFAHADGERAGDFDYYVLALSWSPTWCSLEGDARNAPQCDRGLGFVMHGLWPQYENGWPSYCQTNHREAIRAETGAMADIMGDGGAAWYQWKKHGRCAGLSAQDYFDTARTAFDSVTRPATLRTLDRSVRVPASLIDKAFLIANPDLGPDMVTITCKQNRIQEARICLTKNLQPRKCSADVVRDCTSENALFQQTR